MIKPLEGQFNDWKYGRGILLKFISELSDLDLDKLLPRKKLNTIRLQAEELAQIQSCYVDAFTTRKISFKTPEISDKSKQGLAQYLINLDVRLAEALESADGTETIDWFGSPKSIYEHVSAMIGHEQMHIGQIIAFCYATGIQIPNDIIKDMVLDG